MLRWSLAPGKAKSCRSIFNTERVQTCSNKCMWRKRLKPDSTPRLCLIWIMILSVANIHMTSMSFCKDWTQKSYNFASSFLVWAAASLQSSSATLLCLYKSPSTSMKQASLDLGKSCGIPSGRYRSHEDKWLNGTDSLEGSYNIALLSWFPVWKRFFWASN